MLREGSVWLFGRIARARTRAVKLRTISWYLMVFSMFLRDKIASYLLGTEPLKAPLTTELALPRNILNGGVKRHGRSVPPNRKSEPNSLTPTLSRCRDRNPYRTCRSGVKLISRGNGSCHLSDRSSPCLNTRRRISCFEEFHRLSGGDERKSKVATCNKRLWYERSLSSGR